MSVSFKLDECVYLCCRAKEKKSEMAECYCERKASLIINLPSKQQCNNRPCWCIVLQSDSRAGTRLDAKWTFHRWLNALETSLYTICCYRCSMVLSLMTGVYFSICVCVCVCVCVCACMCECVWKRGGKTQGEDCMALHRSNRIVDDTSCTLEWLSPPRPFTSRRRFGSHVSASASQFTTAPSCTQKVWTAWVHQTSDSVSTQTTAGQAVLGNVCFLLHNSTIHNLLFILCPHKSRWASTETDHTVLFI